MGERGKAACRSRASGARSRPKRDFLCGGGAKPAPGGFSSGGKPSTIGARLEEGARMGFAGIGAAVIGTGFIGTVHVEALRRIGIDVRGVLGSTPERGTDRAQTLGVARAYASLEELLGDRTVDV